MDFFGQTAISTGAASGMGLLFAQQWASLGGNVLMCDVNLPALEEEAARINAQGKGSLHAFGISRYHLRKLKFFSYFR